MWRAIYCLPALLVLLGVHVPRNHGTVHDFRGFRASEATIRSPVVNIPAPRYTPAGPLVLPAAIETWVRVGSSIGLGYTPTDDSPPGMFHNVALEPAAYAEFRRTGRFPNHTQLALTIYAPEQRVPPARQGWFEGRLAAVEMAVKDTGRFAGGWGYFGFGLGGPGTTAPAFPRERCAQCHAAHAAMDNVFLQFYPILRDPPR